MVRPGSRASHCTRLPSRMLSSGWRRLPSPRRGGSATPKCWWRPMTSASSRWRAGLGLAARDDGEQISSGSGRALAALKATGRSAGWSVNLQGDAPFTAPGTSSRSSEAARGSAADVTTPVVQLDWARLDALIAQADDTGERHDLPSAMAPGGRCGSRRRCCRSCAKQAELRAAGPMSPVLQHIGLLLLPDAGARGVRGGTAVCVRAARGAGAVAADRARPRYPRRDRPAGADHHEQAWIAPPTWSGRSG